MALPTVSWALIRPAWPFGNLARASIEYLTRLAADEIGSQLNSPRAKRRRGNGGIPPAQVAEWAGHSVAVLLKIYAKCLNGQDAIAKAAHRGSSNGLAVLAPIMDA